MERFELLKRVFILVFLLSLALLSFTVFFSASAASGASTKVTNLYVPLEGDVTLPNGDVVNFSGQVHVLTRVTFTDAFVPAVQMYVNLIGVEGTSTTTNRTYLLVGAANVEWTGGQPGPPTIPQQTFNFSVVEISPRDTPPSPIVPPSPILPVYLHDFVFAQEAGSEGSLQGVVASFSSE